jgi:hypothetical protein
LEPAAKLQPGFVTDIDYDIIATVGIRNADLSDEISSIGSMLDTANSSR